MDVKEQQYAHIWAIRIKSMTQIYKKGLYESLRMIKKGYSKVLEYQKTGWFKDPLLIPWIY